MAHIETQDLSNVRNGKFHVLLVFFLNLLGGGVILTSAYLLF